MASFLPYAIAALFALASLAVLASLAQSARLFVRQWRATRRALLQLSIKSEIARQLARQNRGI
jgi:hypothetical protein